MDNHVMAPRKEWEKPQLVVLARGEPEERVLLTCKLYDAATGPGLSYGRCVMPNCLDDCSKMRSS